MTSVEHGRGVRVGGEVHLPADLRIPVQGERNPETLRAILADFLREQVRDDPLALVVLAAWPVVGALLVFLIAILP